MTADSKNKLSLPRESLDGREGKIRVLNLYAGIGGNRKLWPNDKIDVTAVEIEPKIAKIYQDFFPNDKVIVADAHQFLLEHFKEFDFIWSSPPCPSHSKARKLLAWKDNGEREQNEPIYPDMKLYQEILLLQGYFKGMWVVENVISWYNPLITPFDVGSHYFWSNFSLVELNNKSRGHDTTIEELEERKGFSLKGVDVGHRKDQILRNCVEPELGLHIFNMAFKDKQKTIKDMIA